LTDTDAAAMVRELRSAPLFFGYHGSDMVDVGAVEDLIQRVAQLKDDLPELESLDLELILVGVVGASTLRASGRVAAPVEARADSATHRLMAAVPPDETLQS
jgi:hypothetical protein